MLANRYLWRVSHLTMGRRRIIRTTSLTSSHRSDHRMIKVGVASAFFAMSIAVKWCDAEKSKLYRRFHLQNTDSPPNGTGIIKDRIQKANLLVWDRHSVAANEPCEDGSCGRLMRFAARKPKKSSSRSRWSVGQHVDESEDGNTHIQKKNNNDMLVTTVFDGHGGAKAMLFLKKHFLGAFEAIMEEILERKSSSSLNFVEVIQKAMSIAYEEADVAFETEALECVLRGQWGAAQVGACVLMACTTDSNIVVANAGDCRALLAVRDKNNNKLRPCQISNDHNAREEVEKKKLREAHDEANVIVEYANNVAYVKGALQTTRSIGDFNLKSKMFNNALPPVYRIDKPYTPPYITAVPEIHVLPRDETQEYLILGTDGLFDELSNEEVVEIVDQWHEKHKDEEGGGGSLSQHLANLALGNAARDIGVSVLDLSRIPKGARRRNLHDDITVIVVRLNRSL